MNYIQKLHDSIDFIVEILKDGRFRPSVRIETAINILNRVKANPMELGSPQMGSTKEQRRLNVSLRAGLPGATKRSKRSC